ncbi:hypothetical protein AAMO2058_001588400 [Amorphochlora amoebiformis]
MVAQGWFISDRIRISIVSVMILVQVLELLSPCKSATKKTIHWCVFGGLWIQFIANLGLNDDIVEMGWQVTLVFRTLTFLTDVLILNYVMYLVNIANNASAQKIRKLSLKLPKHLVHFYIGLSVIVSAGNIAGTCTVLATNRLIFTGIRASFISAEVIIAGFMFIFITAQLKYQLYGQKPNCSSKKSKGSQSLRRLASPIQFPDIPKQKTNDSTEVKMSSTNFGMKSLGNSTREKSTEITTIQLPVNEADSKTKKEETVLSTPNIKDDTVESKPNLNDSDAKFKEKYNSRSFRRKNRQLQHWNQLQLKLTILLTVAIFLYVFIAVVSTFLTIRDFRQNPNKSYSERDEEVSNSYDAASDAAWYADILMMCFYMYYGWSGIDFMHIMTTLKQPFLSK